MDIKSESLMVFHDEFWSFNPLLITDTDNNYIITHSALKE